MIDPLIDENRAKPTNQIGHSLQLHLSLTSRR